MKNKGLAQLGHILNPEKKKATAANRLKLKIWAFRNGIQVSLRIYNARMKRAKMDGQGMDGEPIWRNGSTITTSSGEKP